jgi:hypothetical protein
MFILLPLHVSALLGHLQAEYTTISGSDFTYNRSVVLYRVQQASFLFSKKEVSLPHLVLVDSILIYLAVA